VVLGATMKIVGLVVLTGYALAAGAVGNWLSRRPRFLIWQERFAGLSLIGLGLYIASAVPGSS
jgi:threonine/homoserine/homoserine lactone efflux protein